MGEEKSGDWEVRCSHTPFISADQLWPSQCWEFFVFVLLCVVLFLTEFVAGLLLGLCRPMFTVWVHGMIPGVEVFIPLLNSPAPRWESQRREKYALKSKDFPDITLAPGALRRNERKN